MIYLSVVKDENGNWVILRVITNTINVRGNLTNRTYGDITLVDLETRKMEGFWTQRDVYDNTGDFMIYKDRTTTFDEDTAEVVNTYNYELMPLADIKSDLKNRVDSKRDSLFYSGITFNSVAYSTDAVARLNYVTAMQAFQIDETVYTTDFELKTLDGSFVKFSLADFKLFCIDVYKLTDTLNQKALTIKAAIDAATTYDDIRAAASWDSEKL